MKNVAANVALPDVTYQDRFQRDRLKMPESVGGSTERQRWAQDEITMRRPHFPHLLLGVIKQQKKKKSQILAQFHFIFVWDGVKSPGEAAG